MEVLMGDAVLLAMEVDMSVTNVVKLHGSPCESELTG